nr:tetratricopeptide repeat protein [Acetobacter lovaniensis]
MALACLARGDAEQAESLLRAHLRLNPADAQGWHAMACIARAGGNAAAAVALAGKAVELAGEPFFYITLGLALLEVGHVEQARAAASVAVLATPADPRAHDAMGQILEKAGRLPEAEQALKKALSLRPLEPERHMALAAFLARYGRVEEAISLSARALRLAGEDVAAHNLHAMLLERAGRMGEAEPYFRYVAQAMPDNPQALANHGAALFAIRDYEGAEQALRLSAALAPDVAETLTNLGLVLMAQGRLHSAGQALEAAYRQQPDDARLALNYGTVLMDLGHTQTARDLFTQAMQHATTLQDRARATLDLAGLCLSVGEFAQGWALFEARRDLLAPPHCVASMAQWDGRTTTGAVLLYAEQGLGDALQFLRYVGLAAQRARVSLLVPQSMHALVRCLLPQWGGRVQLYLPEQAGHAEACCSLLSLPQRLGVASPFAWQPDPACFAGPVPPCVGEGLRVGLCWSGNSGYQFDRRRSLAPALLGGLAAVKGVSFQALQPCSRLEDVPLPLSPLPAGDLLATARIIAGLDVVVSVDTMVVHLAGLLGKPTLLLNRYAGDWRWAAASVFPAGAGASPCALERSVWYPSVRIVRQPAPEGDVPSWHHPLATAARWLEQAVLCKEQGGCSHEL